MALDYNGKEIKDLVYLTVKDGFCEVTEFLLFEGVSNFSSAWTSALCDCKLYIVLINI